MKRTLPSVQAEFLRSPAAADRSVGSVERCEAADADALPPVAALAHDLRSPLAAVLGFARLAREDLASGDSARAALLVERIERSASTLEAILRCALGQPDGASATPLRSVLEQVRAERKSELERRGIRFVAPGDAPVIAVRHTDLYRVMSNLIGNAIEHMGEARNATIAVSLVREGEWVTLRVRDNGVGIAPERSELVFAAAHSGCGEGADPCHRGFGLAIVRQLAASWGGRAWLEDAPRPGTTLCVSLPVAR